MEIVQIIAAVFSLIAAVLALLIYTKVKKTEGNEEVLKQLEDVKNQLQQEHDNSRYLVEKLSSVSSALDTSMKKIEYTINNTAMQSEQKLDNIRRTLTESIEKMQETNTTQLESIRKTVDEKLQTALEKKLTDSFSAVGQRLEQVYKGLGEMQTLATGVGDLKRVLSNVKTRGILGEIQLGAILEQMLSPEQYDVNVATKQGSQGNVEFAIKMPGAQGEQIWLPIDSKFPVDAYTQLLDAYDTADQAAVEAGVKNLRLRIRSFAKDIHDKYIDPPYTTDFAIMFFPTEGLYAEAVKAGLVEELQRDFRVNIAGPTTMGALLNSLQMGFRTLAIQKRSGEVWKILGNVKKEFATFESVLESTKKRLRQADEELDKLVGTRTRKIQSALKEVESPAEAADEGNIPLLEEMNV